VLAHAARPDVDLSFLDLETERAIRRGDRPRERPLVASSRDSS